jgi:hypothetical protein
MRNFFLGAVGAAFLTAALVASASRNSSGTMSAINGPYQPGTTISSSIINNRYADIEAELTNSLDRSGRGGMLAALRGVDGTVASPALSFTSEPGSGLYRIGAGDLGMAVLGTKKLELTATLLTLGTTILTANGAVGAPAYSFTSETNSGLYRAGASDLRFAVAGVDKTFWNATGFGVGAAPTFPFDVQKDPGSGSNAVAHFLNAAASSLPLFVESSNNVGIGFNGYYNGANNVYGVTGYGALLLMDGATGDQVFYTAPSGTGGTSQTLTERMRVQAGGLKIGASGTAISASYYGSFSWTPGSVAAGGVNIITISISGVAAGAPCAVGIPGAMGNATVPYCYSIANNCVIAIANPTAGALTPGSGTYSCRVFNP